MLERIRRCKEKLDESISFLFENPEKFFNRPNKDFTRTGKLPFRKVISFLLAMEGKTLTNELLDIFGYSKDTASASAFVQQRNKLTKEALPFLFALFVSKTDAPKTYKGLRLLAVDGSDIQIPTNPNDSDSYHPATKKNKPFNLLYLGAFYDLLQHTYMDAVLMGERKANEGAVACSMIDRSPLENVLLIADRGFEAYNVLAHVQERGWNFLIRIRDITTSRGMAGGLNLPDADEFDLFIDLSLTNRKTAETKKLLEDRNSFKYLRKSFDFFPKEKPHKNPPVFYKLPFRIVRFRISDDLFETVVTNLDSTIFPPDELKKLYAMRWGIETSFRELKHTLGLLHFHAKKVENIYQEVFARLIMYNFTELITSPVILRKADCKYAYKANFSVAVHVCRQFFLGNVSPPDVEAVISRCVSPIRPGRSSPRNTTRSCTISFIYRVA